MNNIFGAVTQFRDTFDIVCLYSRTIFFPERYGGEIKRNLWFVPYPILLLLF